MSLLTTLEHPYRYMALSHCWGSAKVAKQMPNTTSLNLSQHREGIGISGPTKTSQDAVDLTMRLGFEHRWIDCLLIIQEDREDWSNECPRM